MSKSATSSNAAMFTAIDNNVSVAESYVAVTYECEDEVVHFK